MMQLIPPNTNVDFVGLRHKAVITSIVLNILALGLLVIHGPNMGIDFAGGSLVQVRFTQPKQADELRAMLRDTGLDAVDIQDIGREHTDFLIRVPLIGEQVEGVNKKVTGALEQRVGPGQFDILRVEAVGPRVGAELRQRAVLAVLFATLMMGVYIWMRFEWRYGLGAAVALFHDLLVAIGFLVLFNYEFDLTIVAALLTIVGFSVNDTVIVSDRIRENRRKDRRSPLAAVINTSINETLSRTILTTGTAVLVVFALYLLGGVVIHGFAFALLVGFITGTYSSIFIASPIVLFFERPASAAPAAARGQGRAASAARRP